MEIPKAVIEDAKTTRMILGDKLRQKVKDVMKLRLRGYEEVEEEVMDVEFEYLGLNNDQEHPKFFDLFSKIADLMIKIDADRTLELTKDQKIEANEKLAEDLYQRLIEVELDCLKFNLPKLDRFQELSEYEKELKKYMKRWKDEAKLSREKGFKNFKELLLQVDESYEGNVTYGEVRFKVMDTGARLTRLLVDFLFLGSPTAQKLAKRLQLVRTALGCLCVEDSSIFMEIVLDILEVAERKAMEEKLIVVTSSSDEGNGSSSYMSPEEGDIFRKILREFVRFEVCFCCPTLPFMYPNEFLLSMGELFKVHLEEKMNRISCKIDELKKVEIQTSEDTEDLMMNQLKPIFSSTSLIEAKWWNLDLKSNA